MNNITNKVRHGAEGGNAKIKECITHTTPTSPPATPATSSTTSAPISSPPPPRQGDGSVDDPTNDGDNDWKEYEEFLLRRRCVPHVSSDHGCNIFNGFGTQICTDSYTYTRSMGHIPRPHCQQDRLRATKPRTKPRKTHTRRNDNNNQPHPHVDMPPPTMELDQKVSRLSAQKERRLTAQGG